MQDKDTLHSVQELQHPAPQTPGAASILFSNISSPIENVKSLHTAHTKFMHDFPASIGSLPLADLKEILQSVKDFQEEFKKVETALHNALLPRYLHDIEAMLSSLADSEAPNIGHDFIERMRRTNCKTIIDPELKNAAEYVSYSYKKSNRGFINQIGLNPKKLEDVLLVADSIVHEMSHSFQKHAAKALHLSPFNPDTSVIVHPEDWILLEAMCERDAYAKQAFFNHLISQKYPEARENSKFDVVSVEDFENARALFETLQDTLIYLGANALAKPTVMGDQTRTFEHHYFDVALRNYAAGMNARRNEQETGHIFVRLEPEDLYAVGSYGVGPNTFGKNELNKVFMRRPQGNSEQLKRLDDFLTYWNLPSLESCPTMREYTKRQNAPRNSHQSMTLAL